jgi:hypothetical protein
MAAKDHGMKSPLGLPARSRDGILVVVETPAGSRSKLKYLPGVLLLEQNRKSGPGRERNERLLVLPLRAAHGQRPTDVFDLPEQTRIELEDFFLWSTKSEKKDIRLLGWGGVDEAERLLAEAERLAGS